MKTQDKIVNIGLVGLGEHMIRAHVKHLIDRNDVLIKAYYDPDPEAHLGLPAEALAGSRLVSYEEMLGDPTIDAVIIGSPDRFHPDQLLMAVGAGKHVFCEKPMAVTVDDTRKLKAAFDEARSKGVFISTCHPRRFDPPIMWLKQQIDNGFMARRIGELISFEFRFWYHEATEPWKKDRSLLSDHFGHEIDTFRYLFGGNTHWRAEQVYDGYDRYLVWLYAEGARGEPLAAFSGHRSLQESIYPEAIRLLGNKGALDIQLNAGVCLDDTTGQVSHFPGIDYRQRFKAVNDNFIDSIRGTEEPYLTEKDMIINNVSSARLVHDGMFENTD